MKRKLLYVVCCLVLLTGCSKYKVLKCSYEDENSNMKVITTQKYSFDKSGKKIKKINIKTEYIFKEQYTNYLKNNNIDIKDSINTDSICNSYKSFENNKCRVDYKENGIIIDLSVDISKKDSKNIDGDYKFYEDYYKELKYECK